MNTSFDSEVESWQNNGAHFTPKTSPVMSCKPSVDTSVAPSKPRIELGQTPRELQDLLWPEAQLQHEKMQILFARVKAWKPVLDEVLAFISAYHEGTAMIYRQGLRLAKFFQAVTVSAEGESVSNRKLEAVPVAPGELLKSATAALDTYNVKFYTHAKSFEKDLLAKITQINADYTKKTRSFKSTLDRIHETSAKSRQNLIVTFEKQQNYMNTFKVRTTNGPLVDPWISEMTVTADLLQFLDKENKTRQELVAAVKEAEAYEAELILNMHDLMMSFSLFAQTRDTDLSMTYLSLVKFTANIDRSEQFRLFTAEHALLGPCIASEKTVDDLPWRLSTQTDTEDIVKEAVLHRPGTIRKTNFKPCLVIMTVSGFIHCFNMKSTTQNKDEVRGLMSALQFSVFLRSPKLTMEKLGDCCVEINIPIYPKPMFGSAVQKYVIKCNSDAELAEWLEAAGSFLLKNRERPSISDSREE